MPSHVEVATSNVRPTAAGWLVHVVLTRVVTESPSLFQLASAALRGTGTPAATLQRSPIGEGDMIYTSVPNYQGIGQKHAWFARDNMQRADVWYAVLTNESTHGPSFLGQLRRSVDKYLIEREIEPLPDLGLPPPPDNVLPFRRKS